MARALIVVDMLRGFLEEGHTLYCGAESRKIIPNVQRLLRDTQAEGAAIIYLADTHDPDDKEFQMFPPHCVKGAEESEVIPELSDYPGTVIPKRRYSGFFQTDLDLHLRERKIEYVIVVGVVTNICVRSTVNDAFFLGYEVFVPEDCVAATSERQQEAHLYDIDTHYGTVTNLDAVIDQINNVHD